MDHKAEFLAIIAAIISSGTGATAETACNRAEEIIAEANRRTKRKEEEE